MAGKPQNATFSDGLNNLLGQVAQLGAMPDADFQSVVALQTLITDMIGQAKAKQAQQELADKQQQLQSQQGGSPGGGIMGAGQPSPLGGGAPPPGASLPPGMGSTPGPQPPGQAGMGMNPGSMGGSPGTPDMDELARTLRQGTGNQ